MSLFELFSILASMVALIVSVASFGFLLLADEVLPFDVILLLFFGGLMASMAFFVFAMIGFRIVVPKQEKDKK